MNRLTRIILMFLSTGEKPRHMVTEKMKNYDKTTRELAITYLMTNELIRLREAGYEDGRKGRTPVYIKLTGKGLDLAKDATSDPCHIGVWSVSKKGDR